MQTSGCEKLKWRNVSVPDFRHYDVVEMRWIGDKEGDEFLI